MHSRIMFAELSVLVSFALTGGCTIGVAPTASSLPSSAAIFSPTSTATRLILAITPTPASSTSIASRTTARTATIPAATSSSRASAPAWWPSDLSMLGGMEYQGESDTDKLIPDRIARWVTEEPNLDALRDQLAKQCRDAGYTVTVLEKANGLHVYDLLLVKGVQAFQLVLLGQPPSTTHIDGHVVPTFEFKTTGAVTQAIVLPMMDWGIRSNLQMSLATPPRNGPTPDLRTTISATRAAVSLSLRLVALQPNDRCPVCRTALTLTIPAYQGPGTYTTVDVQVNPGGDATTGNYRNPATCTIVVEDEFNGTFECRSLTNQADETKTIDLNGTWQAPVR